MKKRTLKKELTILMLTVSACTIIFLCIAIMYFFSSFFIQNTKEDIAYVLTNTTEQYQAHMQFIKDGAVSVRHNSMLRDFFDTYEYEETALEVQLSYSMELFADRNMIDRQIPFVSSVYLFNKHGDCITEHYYATTLATRMSQESGHKNLQKQFQASKAQYQYIIVDDVVNLCFRIYDDDMVEKGTCIAEINQEAIQLIFSDLKSYQDVIWGVMADDGIIISSQGTEEELEELKGQDRIWNGTRPLFGKNVIGYADTCGFGLRTVVTVGQNNVYAILRPTMIVLILGFCVVAVVTIALAFGASYRFSKPVTRMIESIRAFGKQDFDARMEDSDIQEFHDIGIVFNEMADRIKYLILQVYQKQLLASRSQVKYLQSQVNPHFQYNILAMLSLKAKMAGNEELYEGLHAFSKLMQGKIFREKEIKIKISEELEIVNFYLQLQKSRYEDKLSYQITIENDEIKQDLIPRLLIEPLVENAVSHGLEPKSSPGNLWIRLFEKEHLMDCSVSDGGEQVQRKNMLHICVEDDGVGFDSEQLSVNEAEQTNVGDLEEEIDHTHTGLENTKRMLQVLYGERHEFHITGEKGVGTKIEIMIPVEREDAHVENNGG